MKKIILLYACFCCVSTSISAQCTLKLAVDTVYHPSCPDDKDAAILLKTTNGRAPFSYNWAYQDIPLLDRNRQTLPNIPSGKYSVTVTDAAGCRDSILNIIVKKDTSFVTVTTTPTTNGLDGKATVIYTIGTVSYTQNFTNLRFGDNRVYVTHPRGCTISLIVKIAGPMTCGLKLAVDSIYQPSCYGQPTGRIIVKSSKAILPLSYSWLNDATNNPMTTQTTFVLPSVGAGVYGIKVTDAMGCRDSLLNLIVKEDTPKITITTTPATNGQNGTATVTVIIGKDTSVQRFTNLKIGDTSLIIISNQVCPYGSIPITITGTTAVNDLYTEGLEKFDIIQNSGHQATVFIKFKENREVDLSVFTVLGQEIKRQTLVGQDMQMDLSDLPVGVLLFSLKMKDKIMTKKVVMLK
jgi:hypothetical protein